MAAFFGGDLTLERHSQEGDVADYVEDLMADEGSLITDEMRASIGERGEPWTCEVDKLQIRLFARSVRSRRCVTGLRKRCVPWPRRNLARTDPTGR